MELLLNSCLLRNLNRETWCLKKIDGQLTALFAF